MKRRGFIGSVAAALGLGAAVKTEPENTVVELENGSTIEIGPESQWGMMVPNDNYLYFDCTGQAWVMKDCRWQPYVQGELLG
jgi:hypothetical protein